ncbi:MAG: hypothetical protein HOP29_02675 [Phycisphaerales bacterium]|nr:hypothetical protein [Phycisphaerales bacterium]
MKHETIPGFDCVAYKWKVQSEIYEKIKDMTVEEEIAYFRQAAETGPFAHLLGPEYYKNARTPTPRR